MRQEENPRYMLERKRDGVPRYIGNTVSLRRSFAILLFSLAGIFAHSQDAPDFTSYAWGTPLSDMQSLLALKPLKEEGATVSYSSNISSLGDARLDDCQFEFTEGRFSGIAATTPGEADSQKLLQWLESRFGPGQDQDPLGWQWFLDGTHIWFDMAKAGEGWLYWYSLTLNAAKEKR